MKKILVIEDDVDTLSVVVLILSAEGYMVRSFSKWKTGYEYIPVFKPHLIVLDVHLGTADGRNLAKQLKHKPETCNIPIILFSGNHSVKDNLMECGANDFIPKPIKVDHFIEMISLNLTDKKDLN